MLKPKHSENYPDRDIDCQEAVVTEIMELIESAKNAGWEEAETATAIAIVARGLVTGFLNDAQDE